MLLLDEPSKDLDVETLRALEDALAEFAGSVLVISHDRWFLDRITTHILAAEGDPQWSFFEGDYREYEADKKRRLGEGGARPHRIRYKALLQSGSPARGVRPAWPNAEVALCNMPQRCVSPVIDANQRTCAHAGV